MKRLLQLITIIGGIVAVSFVLFSCNDRLKNHNYVKTSVEYEMEKLTNEMELDSVVARGDDNIVDWQLSREFAELYLAESIDAKEYPNDSELWQVPIAVYDKDGKIKFYEFRVVSNGKVIAYITGAATKDYNCPILYQSLCDGYADEIEELYNSGKLAENQIIRVVDNGYPNVVFGISGEMRGGVGEFDLFVDPSSDVFVDKESITHTASYDELINNCPRLFAGKIDEEKMRALIEADKENGKMFWEMAVANKGHIADFATRGGSKRTELDSENIRRTIKNTFDMYGDMYSYYREGERIKKLYNCEWIGSIANYGACGAVASGFVLDYLATNFKVYNSWKNLDYSNKRKSLYERMGIGNGLLADVIRELDLDGDSVTLPWNIGCAIAYHSGYATVLSGYNYPKAAIEHNLPGISLRAFGSGGMHYRPVIAYKCNGWWAFSWPSFKILDLVDCSDTQSQTNGKWETYIPIYHILNWNILPKKDVEDWSIIFEAWGD